MKVWLPYIRGGSGADVSTEYLAEGLRAAGIEATAQMFVHPWQFCPWPLCSTRAPVGTQIVLANSWNGFVFWRRGCRLVVVERLFVFDPAFYPYRTFAQGMFHELFVKSFVRRSYALADAIIALSAYSENKMKKIFPNRKPVTIINAVDTDFFTPKDNGPASNDMRPTKLLFVGNPIARKGADLLPRIIEHLGAGYEILYTTGLRSQDPFKGISGMRSIGNLSQIQVREAYRDADLLLLPTRLEGLPRAAMEAMACGTPVVSSSAASLPEVVDQGVTGMRCPTDDVDAYVSAICELSGDPVRLAEMGRAARRAAEERFSLNRMIVEYVDLFEKLLRIGEGDAGVESAGE